MSRTSLKAVVVCAWILAIGAFAALRPAMTMSGWIALAGVALLPPIFLLRASKRPSQTMSEDIQRALGK